MEQRTFTAAPLSHNTNDTFTSYSYTLPVRKVLAYICTMCFIRSFNADNIVTPIFNLLNLVVKQIIFIRLFYR